MKHDFRAPNSEDEGARFCVWLEQETIDSLRRSCGDAEATKSAIFLFANRAYEAHMPESQIGQLFGRCIVRAGFQEKDEEPHSLGLSFLARSPRRCTHRLSRPRRPEAMADWGVSSVRTPRPLVLVLSAAGILGFIIWWAGREPCFATPAECVDALYQAALDGDVHRYVACLIPYRRGNHDLKSRAHIMAASVEDLQRWFQAGVEIWNGDGQNYAKVRIIEDRPGSRRQVFYFFEQHGGCWQITEIEHGKDLPERPK